MAPLFMIRMVAPILESMRIILGTQSLNLLFRLLAVFATLAVFLVGFELDMALNDILIWFTAANFIVLLVSMYSVLYKIKMNLVKITISMALCSGVGIGLAYLIGLPFV